MSHKDPWVKTRSYGNHLSDEEIERIRKGWENGEIASVIAEELKCATRTVNVWFSKFRGTHGKPAPKPSERYVKPPVKRKIPAPNCMPWCLSKLTARRA